MSSRLQGRLLLWLRLALPMLRAALVGLLLVLCLRDWPAMQARNEFAALPDFDYAAEAQALLGQDRFSEALLVLDAGIAAGAPSQKAQLETLKAAVEARRDSWLRRIGEAGEGALSGRGDSVEALAGAVVADLFVFGDVRDLVIQGARAARGEETDDVIVALSAAGLLLTVTPALDLGAALLKFARKAGALSDAFARQVLRLLRSAADSKSAAPVTRLLDDAASLSRSARPAGAIAILKHVDDPADLHRAARHAQEPGGAFALWLGGRESLTWLKAGGRHADELLIRAARKGRAGIAFLAAKGRLLLRPHPLLGLLKGFYKGNLQDLLALQFPRFAEALLGLLAGWLLFELVLVAVRTRRLLRDEAPAVA